MPRPVNKPSFLAQAALSTAFIALLLMAGLKLAGGASKEPETDGSPHALWADHTAETIGQTAEWTNKVELGDLNGDGLVDLLFANGGNYRAPGTPEPSRVFLNQGPGKPFREATTEVFGPEGMLVRSIKAGDANGDGHLDIVAGATYQTQSRLILGDGKGGFTDATANLPQTPASIGDLEFGDVDGDGDLDLVLADWGEGNPMQNAGGRTKLWLNDGKGRFTDATAERMPETLVRFSWDVEFVDVDNDYDLDILVASKMSAGSFLFRNDGKGKFTDDTEGNLPQFTNNYEFEAIDLDGDGFLDLTTINDGGVVPGTRNSRKENVFANTGKGGFRTATADWFPDTQNLGYDDNRTLYLDFDSDGDADVLIGSLDGPDRLLINDGKGHLTTAVDVFTGTPTRGTLCLAVADLNGDGKLDVVMGQGEVKSSVDERVFFGENIPPDTAAPRISLVEKVAGSGWVHARVHDNKSPLKPHDLQSVKLVLAGGKQIPMQWYGEYLWRAKLDEPAAAYQVCATDAVGNAACATPAGAPSPVTWIPASFDPPTELLADAWRLAPLGPAVTRQDYEAYMSSIDHLKATFSRGGNWPRPGLTMVDAKKDMAWESERFAMRSAFSYSVLTPDGSRELGCVYVSPSRKKGYDAMVRLWVTKAEFDRGFEKELYARVRSWLKEAWPFEKVAYPGREIPWDQWDHLP